MPEVELNEEILLAALVYARDKMGHTINDKDLAILSNEAAAKILPTGDLFTQGDKIEWLHAYQDKHAPCPGEVIGMDKTNPSKVRARVKSTLWYNHGQQMEVSVYPAYLRRVDASDPKSEDKKPQRGRPKAAK